MHPMVDSIRVDGDVREGVVLLHGWTGSPAHFRLLAPLLAERGHSVRAPLLPGHGTDPADMLATTWRDWVRVGVEAAGELVSAGSRLHIVGLSMGGAIGLLMAPALGAASLTTINAPMKVHDRLARFSWLVRGTRRMRPHPSREAPADEAAAFHLQYEQSPLGAAADLFDLVRAARANLARVTCPTLVIQSRADETVRPGSAIIIHDRISSPTKRVVWLEHARHVALVDPERAVVHSEILAHIARSR